MKPLLIGTILGASLWPASAGAQAPSSPFSRHSLQAAAAALTSAGADRNHPSEGDWSRVIGLRPGTGVIVLRASAPPMQGQILMVDDASLTLLDIETVQPRSLVASLSKLATTNPERLAAIPRGGTYTSDEVRLTPEGVLLHNKKVAEIARIIQRHPREDVEVVSTVTRPASESRGLRTALTVLGGFYLGAAVAVGTTSCEYSQRNSRCHTPWGAHLAFWGIPIGLGALDYHVRGPHPGRVIYRASR